MKKMSVAVFLMCLLGSVSLAVGDGDNSTYWIGTGRYDITGPSTEIEFMGYASPTQTGKGIHLRQFSRAFIFADAKNESRVVFVNADICMGSQIIKMKVIEKLQSVYGSEMYTHDNVLISGIHTHSGPAGYFQYFLFEVMSLGFVEQTLNATVNGIVESIHLAHNSMQEGKLYFQNGTLFNTSRNRSPTAYQNNPKDEIDQYKDEGDTDKGNVVLKMVDKNGSGFGLINWFGVHCTSMNNTNHLISSDNKGLASLMMENYKNGGKELPGRGHFVAAFAQSNEGDISPNLNGSKCLDTGEPCDNAHSTCNGKNEMCVSQGPGRDMFESTKIIANKQFEAARALYDTKAQNNVSGPIRFVYKNVDFSNVTVTLANGSKVHTCRPAMGRSFAAGTTDGPGAFDFVQGDTNKTNALWNSIRDILRKPSKEQVECHAPKPILLDTGEMDIPYPWSPKIMPLQILQIGQFVIVGVPAEFTTMSGRRLRAAVHQALSDNGFSNAHVVIAGLSNTYADYVTTYEEYQVQRYEGASTIFGPHTLEAYIQEFSAMATSLAKGEKVDPGPDFPNYYERQIALHFPVLYDEVPSGKKFGDVITDVKNTTYQLNDMVEVSFWAGNPRNCLQVRYIQTLTTEEVSSLQTNDTYLTVERQESAGPWQILYTDASWETQFSWEQTSLLEGHSKATITWDIPSEAVYGLYRIRHFGCHKPATGSPTPYNGTSSSFVLLHK